MILTLLSLAPVSREVRGKVKGVQTRVYTWVDYKIKMNKADMLKKKQYQMKGTVKCYQ